jgi:hypothetical protein
MRYAAQTSVSVERSKVEVERTLTRYGATEFASGWKDGKAAVMFRMHDRAVRFILPLPDRMQFTHDGRGAKRNNDRQVAAFEQACRQKWRALSLAIKAKLEAVESGITTFESEFLAHIVLPGGATAGDWLIPQLAVAYESKSMPPLLEYGGP